MSGNGMVAQGDEKEEKD